MPARLVVLASGSGTNLQAIIDACANGSLDAEVVAVISDRPDAFALNRARTHAIASVQVPLMKGQERAQYDQRLCDVVLALQPDWVVMAGFMRILGNVFLSSFPGQVINLHPALPGELPGTRAIERAFAEYLTGSRTESGVMVHRVPDQGVDDGPVLATATIPFMAGDTVESFATRMHAAERRLLVETLIALTKDTAR